MKYERKTEITFTIFADTATGGTATPAAAKSKVAMGETKLKEKHTGIVKSVTDAKSYVTPALITDDAIYMEGRLVRQLMIHF
ncbi:TPA: hypothetical protein R1907_001942 [Staphylococcus delphini]|uniref:hypothetical protein n=1 Tax=Staphylococcus delphini TaxID=53344 RepID=UPI000BBB8753|nr:hypothetical protein [Staphylococcus delphini]PCF45317.1 hypothetical protein B5B98_08225 [Staphylococcus delphini]PCF72940.1 hypothetical protein B4W73_08795 [Staphylococcus delphini]PCF84182.1 hypothetical protein B4W69_05670 [Staphylococcus delphini]HEC2156214.1 hypothetical protein [Staphylococcus delphini]HEC2176263.1 hypothetical protein [Staphylococcus delphini]